MVARAENLALLGGVLCLDFTNTIEPRTEGQPREYLVHYSDLVGWSRHVDILTDEEAESLLNRSATLRAEAEVARERAITLREAIYRLFCAIAQKRSPKMDDLNILNNALPEALTRLKILPTEEGFALRWVREEGALDSMLWPIVWSATKLLTTVEPLRLKQCDGCGWLFLDESRNRSRRWCDMSVCGNRAKARRYYQRHRKQSK
jgi:predicted RNA-binding Zn ribbon-like protein